MSLKSHLYFNPEFTDLDICRIITLLHPSLPVSCLNPPYPVHPPVPHMVTNRAVIACLSWVGVEIVENQNMYHNSFIAP